MQHATTAEQTDVMSDLHGRLEIVVLGAVKSCCTEALMHSLAVHALWTDNVMSGAALHEP